MYPSVFMLETLCPTVCSPNRKALKAHRRDPRLRGGDRGPRPYPGPARALRHGPPRPDRDHRGRRGRLHGVVGHHVWPSYMISSFVLFGLLSALYMYGRRSLTPPLIAHAMTHFLGDPALMRGILYGVALAG